MTEINIGPLQEIWLNHLETHPGRQMTGKLGRLENNENKVKYKACCLGQALVCLKQFSQGDSFNVESLFAADGDMLEPGSNVRYDLTNSFHELGLRDSVGSFTGEVVYSKKDSSAICSLANLNDQGWTWSEIAKFVRSNPNRVFTKSV